MGSVIPFLSIFINPENILKNDKLFFVFDYFNINSANQLYFPITLIFIFFVIFSGVLRIYLLKFTVDISVKCGSDLSVLLYEKTLKQDYLTHIKTNSSQIISGISQKLNDVISGVLWTFMNLLTSSVMSLFIVIFLIYLQPLIAIICFLFFGIFYLLVTFLFTKKLEYNSKKIAKEQTQVVKSLQEGLGNIRDVLLSGTQNFYLNIYKNSDFPLRKSLGNNQFISLLPKYIIESFGLIILAIVAYIISYNNSNFIHQIPILGALALGAQKLLPAFQTIYFSYSRIIGTRSSLIDIIILLDQKVNAHIINAGKKVIYENKIQIKKLYYRYISNEEFILNDINLEINKNSIFGIIGKSGSGKSTLIDIIAGLLSPTKGIIKIDNVDYASLNIKSWQSKISYVPQNIFLSESTFLENIAFGIKKNEIDRIQAVEAAKKAQIFDYIQSTKYKFDTIISEKGFDLSGGQRQRLAIARSLYKNPEILILDEFTSSLDSETESKLFDMIFALKSNVTILLVSHQKTALKYCDNLIML